MFERFLISAVIIMAAVILMLAAALVKAMADKRIADEDARMERIRREDAWSVAARAINIKTEYRAYRAALEEISVNFVFSGWEFIKPAEGCRDYYIEKDGIRIIVEDGKAVGWYKPMEAAYKAPVAEVVAGG